MYTEFGTEHKLVILPRSRVRGVKLEEGAKSDMKCTAEVVIDPQCGTLLNDVSSVQR